jgi:hypothetical protein
VVLENLEFQKDPAILAGP